LPHAIATGECSAPAGPTQPVSTGRLLASSCGALWPSAIAPSHAVSLVVGAKVNKRRQRLQIRSAAGRCGIRHGHLLPLRAALVGAVPPSPYIGKAAPLRC
jgi:hypothetical protein